MHWIERYRDKVSSAEAAIAEIAPGQRIFIGSGAAEPHALVEGLVTHGDHLYDNEIVHLLTLGPAPYVAPELQHRFRHTAFFIGPNVRRAVQEGRADFMPVFLSEIPRLIRSRRVGIDVALVQVSPPDRHGYVSLGVSVDVVRSAVDNGGVILAEVNEQMPRTYGQSFLHVSHIRRLLPVNRPLPEHCPEALDDISKAIGEHVAGLIPDGATLQTGIGRIPDAVMAALGNHRDLGVHTEMFSDGVKTLVEAGVITGRRKSLEREKIVTSFVMGSRDLYRWVDENPAIEMRPSDYTNDPFIIAQNHRMIAINSALAVDLTGQVAADTLRGRFFSGIGGQVDFIRGAARSEGGKPIIALPSTAKKGTLSRICPSLEEGAGVVTSRGDVHYVVTEYGVADLWGKNIRQRAQALIDIAHPDFKAELMAQAKGRKYVVASDRVPTGDLPWREARTLTLKNGAQIQIRPVRLSDQSALKELLYRVEDESIRARFVGEKPSADGRAWQQLVDLDYADNLAMVVSEEIRGREELLAVARYDVIPAISKGHLRLVVRDDMRRRGVGGALFRRMVEIARARGLRGFTMELPEHDQGLLALLATEGFRVRTREREGAITHSIRFERRPGALSRGLSRS